MLRVGLAGGRLAAISGRKGYTSLVAFAFVAADIIEERVP
jgi:hypothetical protein